MTDDLNESEVRSNDEKEFRLIRLRNDSGDLGIFIAKSEDRDDHHIGYYVAFIMPDGVVKR